MLLQHETADTAGGKGVFHADGKNAVLNLVHIVGEALLRGNQRSISQESDSEAPQQSFWFTRSPLTHGYRPAHSAQSESSRNISVREARALAQTLLGRCGSGSGDPRIRTLVGALAEYRKQLGVLDFRENRCPCDQFFLGRLSKNAEAVQKLDLSNNFLGRRDETSITMEELRGQILICREASAFPATPTLRSGVCVERAASGLSRQYDRRKHALPSQLPAGIREQ